MKCMYASYNLFWSINANNNGGFNFVGTDHVPCFCQLTTVLDARGILQYNQTGRLRTAEGVLWRHRPCTYPAVEEDLCRCYIRLVIER